jgi:hypothetical protein
MTRRKFLYRIGVAASAIGGCLCWMGRKALPRRVVRADRVERYPGTIVPMGDIRTQSKWSG